jgi:hypothetical protein
MRDLSLRSAVCSATGHGSHRAAVHVPDTRERSCCYLLDNLVRAKRGIIRAMLDDVLMEECTLALQPYNLGLMRPRPAFR